MSYDRFMRRHGGVITAPTDAVLPEFDLRVFQSFSGGDLQAFTTRFTSPNPDS